MTQDVAEAGRADQNRLHVAVSLQTFDLYPSAPRYLRFKSLEVDESTLSKDLQSVTQQPEPRSQEPTKPQHIRSH